MIIDPQTADLKQWLVETRRYLHEHPEASLKEFETSKWIKKHLDNWNIPYVNVGDTGVLATLKGEKKGNTVLLRADMDALELDDLKDAPYASKNPGLCHACGHDAHTTALLGALKILKERTAEIPGTILFAFQQAEEIGAGARQFVQSGLLDNVDLAYGQHVSSPLPSGKIDITPGPRSASCDIFTIRIKGKGSHASRPHEGRDAALATAHILVALQSLMAREKDPFEPGVLSIGRMEAGTRYNVVAETGELEGTLRIYDIEKRKYFLKRIEEIAIATATLHGCEASFENYNASNALINEEDASAYAKSIIEEIVGPGAFVSTHPSLGAEDFADYGQITQAAYAHIGTCSSEKTGWAHHNGHFDIDEDQLPLMVQIFVDIALKNDRFIPKKK